MNEYVTPEEFIRIWQSSATLIEVAKDLKMDKSAAYSRAAYYRNRGVPLQKFPNARNHNWQPLIELAASLEPVVAPATEEQTT